MGRTFTAWSLPSPYGCYLVPHTNVLAAHSRSVKGVEGAASCTLLRVTYTPQTCGTAHTQPVGCLPRPALEGVTYRWDLDAYRTTVLWEYSTVGDVTY